MPEKLWIPPRPNIESPATDSEILLEQKLNTIKQKRGLRVVPDLTHRNPSGFKDLYLARLPYTKGISIIRKDDSTDITLFDLDLGDRSLYGHGVGTRLLQRVIEDSLQVRPDIETISRGAGNWALVRTLGKVLGRDELVRFEKGNHRYGAHESRLTQQVLVDYPPVMGEEYRVKNIVGFIDPATLMSAEDAITGITTTIE